MKSRVIQLFCVLQLCLSTNVLANLQGDWSELVEYQQTITFLLITEASNDAARKQNIHIARNLYFQKQQIIFYAKKV